MTWRQATLGDFVALQRGHDLPTQNRENGTVPIMGSFGVTGHHSKAKAKGPGVTVGRSGASIGVTSYIDQDYWPLNTCMYVTDFKGNNPRYVYYLLQTLDLAAHNSGSAQPSLNRNYIYPIDVSFPDRSVQDRIVDLLGSLDDKIELNRRMNETLEEMARALFRDWFVDFGPTRRQAEGATDPAAIMGHAFPPEKAATLASLFPATLGGDGLPEGWKNQPVSDFGKLKGGKQLPKTEFVADGPFPVFGGAGHMGHTDKFNAEGYVITVGRVGVYCGNFVSHRGKAWVNNNASVFQLAMGTEPEWFYLALRELDLEPIKKGAAQPFVSNGDINELPLVEPGAAVRQIANDTLSTLLMKLEANEKENQTLAEMRDLLLPKLMSGEIRLKDVEAAT